MRQALALLWAMILFGGTFSAPQATAEDAPEHAHRIGFETGIWHYNRTTDYHNAIVRVVVGSSAGTGTIVHVDRDRPSGTGFQGHCVTAYHIIRTRRPGQVIRIHYTNGRTAKDCRLVAFDAEFDIALLSVWVPDGIVSARLAPQPIKGRDPIEFCGLGGNSKLKCCLRSFSAHAALPTTGNQLYADVSLLPGDSGGPVFDNQHQLVGVISGGWFWWEGGIRDRTGSAILATWPARAANRDALQRLLDKIKGRPSTEDVTPSAVKVAQHGGS